ncbi:hypothetical protein FNV43_RR09833 [Rhamnella rubrinervis]|uniref:non-specific serine/threonine protein kinase n=1 Tax=Rhamnella rubrinervis TaxID=2594499 RepID=A0A8K0HBG7_9ROSA|nr:hypothetical protein FNV43_RR09833 [Rhamnella rubrinervis]
MLSKLLITLSTLFIVTVIAAHEDLSFTYNGFRTANLSLDGIAEFTPNGLLRLTNGTEQQKGHAFTPIQSEYRTLSGHGICFVIAPTRGLPGALPSQYLGLFNESNNGNDINHVIAVELDTTHSCEFDDINDNHVGIDINGLKSENSSAAGYYEDKNDEFKNLTLINGRSMKVWVEYDGEEKQMNVTLAPSNIGKPHTPLLSLTRDLSSIVNNTIFKINGQAQELVLSQLPELPRMGTKDRTPILTAGLALTSVILTTLTISGIIYLKRWKRKFAELVEDWEVDSDYATQRAEGIRGGNSQYGEAPSPEFGTTLGLLPAKGELMLVYDYMSNGSLDKYLFDQPKTTLNWSLRFRIIKGVASGLFYLHEGWEQVVIHRDIKAGNVLLDSEFNARLGDFGLARLYDHGTDPQTTHVVGTLGYLAPEHTRTGRRPIEARGPEDKILVDQVYSCWKEGNILAAKDPKLGTNFVAEEVELVMMLGLICSDSVPSARPSMRQVVQYLDGDIPL